MIVLSKRNRIIKKAVAKTVLAFADRTPKLFAHFFYGAVDVGPQNLVVWFLFETDAELETARASGLCDELREATIHNLISLGYPQEAFDLGQHRTMGAASFGGSFAPIVQYEKWEIHKVFPHFPYFRLVQNLSPNLLAPLCGVALDQTELPTEEITFQGSLQEDMRSLTGRKATVSFTTKEDVDNKANGDYHLYFQ